MIESEAIQKTARHVVVRSKGHHGLGNLREHRGNWWLDLTHEKKRHRIKLGPIKLLEKRQARQIADARILALIMPKSPEPPPEKGTMTHSEFAEKFVAWAGETKRSWVRYGGKLGKANTPSLRREFLR